MKFIKGFAVGFGILIVLSLSILWFFRNEIAWNVTKKMLKKADSNGIVIEFEDFKIIGLNTVQIHELSIQAPQQIPVLNCKDIEVKISLFELLFGNIVFNQTIIDQTYLNVILTDSVNNIPFIIQTDSVLNSTSNASSQQNIAQSLYKSLNNLFGFLHGDVSAKGFVSKIALKDAKMSMNIDSLGVKDNIIYGEGALSEDDQIAQFKLLGNINPNQKQFYVQLMGLGKAIQVPLIKKLYDVSLSFDTLSTSLNEIKYSDKLYLSGTWGLNNIAIDNQKIAPKPIQISKLLLNTTMFFTPNTIGFDSSSVFSLNDLNTSFYAAYTTAPVKKYALIFNIPKVKAQQFFNAFPHGLFYNLEGIQVEGDLSYFMQLYLDSAHPDEVVFKSELKKEDFKITAWGNTNLQKINGGFTHIPYYKDNAGRSIVVGENNPNFYPIERINPQLINAIITTEDATFKFHKGFNEDAFRKAIGVNYAKRKFIKGASTITMQLVKNVFLTRNKNITRKIEEALIVWMLESNYMVSKNRIMEVYLNIIEWGPNVYGIGEASRFYFNTTPDKLTYAQCVYLASIIPSPKKFKYTFDEEAKLKKYMTYIFNLVSRRMLAKGQISEADTVKLMESVKLTGIAYNQLKLKSLDDSLSEDEKEGFFDNIFIKKEK